MKPSHNKGHEVQGIEQGGRDGIHAKVVRHLLIKQE
jgi:hypothetical protein